MIAPIDRVAVALAALDPAGTVQLTLTYAEFLDLAALVVKAGKAKAAAPPAELTPTEEAILAAAGPTPVARKLLVKRSGHPVNSHTYAAVRGLLRRALLAFAQTGELYRPAVVTP